MSVARTPEYDALTGLHGREWLAEELGRMLLFRNTGDGSSGKWTPGNRRGVLILLDLDHFKLINETRGHAVGDRVLVIVADRLRAAVRDLGRVARMGGDEFAILVDESGDDSGCVSAECASDEAIAVADAVGSALDSPLETDGFRFVVTASIGINPIRPAYISADEVLRDAEIAMYRAKSGGRNRWECFEEPMREHVSRRMDLETELRTAVRTNGIQVKYQPIIRIFDGVCVGFEALARWPHAEFGLVMPGVFIPLAEESNLILELGRYMIREAARQIAIWKKDYPDRIFYVSVNLSPLQIRDSFLIEKMVETVIAEGAAPSDLVLELTESVFLENPTLTGKMIDSAREKGFRIYLDDFGSGYSSIGYLRDYHFDAIKIDRQFLSGLGRDNRAARLLGIFADIASVFDLGIVMEGVEDKSQFDLLSEMRIDAIQGDYFSRPVDASRIGEWIAALPRST